MFLLHYILPLAIFYFYRDKMMLWGLLLANLIDLDHIYYRIIGKVGWFESACERFGLNCSIGFYPLHTWAIAFIGLFVTILILHKNKKLRFIGWIGLGIFIHMVLDLIHELIGFGI